MKVLVGCEASGVVRDAFRARGHDAYSCDLRPSENGGPHFQCDIFTLLSLDDDWDLFIVFPDCTYLCSSGLHGNKRIEGRQEKTEEALRLVEKLMTTNIKRWSLENPVGCISTRIRKPDQYFQPYCFGHDASKKTGLWLNNLPKLEGTHYKEPRIVEGKKRWSNQTDRGQNKLGPSDDRWIERSRTYEGVAEAMANQWGSLDV